MCIATHESLYQVCCCGDLQNINILPTTREGGRVGGEGGRKSVCVCEREGEVGRRGRGREGGGGKWEEVCVYDRERKKDGGQRERERETDKQREGE